MGTSSPETRASAVRQAFDLLTETHALSAIEAYAYVCAAVELRAAAPSGSMGDELDAALAVVPAPAIA